MGIFDDKQYDEMDWLTQAIEPTVSSINEVLHSIPNEIEVDHAVLLNLIKGSWGDINFREVVDAALEPYTQSQSRANSNQISNCFKLHMEGEIFVDIDNETISGPKLRIIKEKTMFEEEELAGFMGQNGLPMLLSSDISKMTIERCNEIAELLGCNEATKKRSINQKFHFIYKTVNSNIRENKWNIKNTDLADKVCIWIKAYLVDGSLPSLANFCKFKVMTHNGDAIYSIEEEPI